jgi:hypothetical protein
MKLEKGLKPNFEENEQIKCDRCDNVTDKIGSNPYAIDDYVCPKCWDGAKEYQEYEEWYAEYGEHADVIFAAAH